MKQKPSIKLQESSSNFELHCLKEESIKLRIDDPPRKHATKQHLQPFCKKPPNYQLPASTMKALKITKTSFYGNSKMTDYNQNSKSDKIILQKNANNSKEKLSSTTTSFSNIFGMIEGFFKSGNSSNPPNSLK